jgi:hypothetical protein
VVPVVHKNIELVNYPGNGPYSNIKQDVYTHVGRWQSFGDLLVDIHENTHLIDRDLYNKYHRPAFYVLNDRVAVIDDIKQTPEELAKAIPKKYRGSVYKTYISDMRSRGHTTSLDILEELNAYLSSTEASITMKIPFNGNNKFVEELTIYTLYTEGVNPLFLKYELQRSLKCGSKIPSELQSQVDRILAQ